MEQLTPSIRFVNGQGLSRREFDLYGRQILLPQIGVEGQRRLNSACVVLVGAGGLGSPCALYIASAGIGRLKILDGDSVTLTNLHRQIIHSLEKLGRNKAESAAEECRKRNDIITIETINEFLTAENAEQIVQGATVVVDASDNAQTRYLVNDICCRLDVPLVSGSALGWEGQLSVYNYLDGPCYRCIFPFPPTLNNSNACELLGVVGTAPGTIGVLQANEAVKVCLGLKDSVLSGRLLLLDCLSAERMWRTIKLKRRRNDCSTCKHGSKIQLHTLSSTCPNEEALPLSPHEVIPAKVFYERMLEIVNGDEDGRTGLLQVRSGCTVVDGITHVVVDVRRPQHYANIHIRGSNHFSLDQLLHTADLIENEKDSDNRLKRLEELRTSLGLKPSDKEVNLYILCRKGRDAARATKTLNFLFTKPDRNNENSKYPFHISSLVVSGGLNGLIQEVPDSLSDYFSEKNLQPREEYCRHIDELPGIDRNKRDALHWG